MLDLRRHVRGEVSKVRSMKDLNEVRWTAVQSRDSTMAGCFVYAVTTTGIFGRPGCGARRPLRSNVRYFSTGDEACAAGYRACKRCLPDEARRVDVMTEAVIGACREFERTRGGVTSPPQRPILDTARDIYGVVSVTWSVCPSPVICASASSIAFARLCEVALL